MPQVCEKPDVIVRNSWSGGASLPWVPQQMTVRSLRSAQVRSPPAAIEVYVPSGGSLRRSDSVMAVAAGFHPQQAMVRSLRSAQVWASPALTAV